MESYFLFLKGFDGYRKSATGELNKNQAMDERSDFGIEAVEREEREFVAKVRDPISHLLQVIALSARQSGDIYWVTNKMTREEGLPEEQCRVGTRVRLVNGNLVAEWYRNRFITDPAASKKTVLSTHLKKGKGFKYSMANFAKEPEWAKQVIQEVEDQYALHRQRAAVLSDIKRSLNEYEKLLEKTYSA